MFLYVVFIHWFRKKGYNNGDKETDEEQDASEM